MSDTERKAFQWPTGRQYYAAIAGMILIEIHLIRYRKKNYLNHIYNLANLIMLANGTIIGWFSPALPKVRTILNCYYNFITLLHSITYYLFL